MEILKDFGLNPLLLGAQIVNFVILLFLLQRFLYKPIMKVLDERKKKVELSLKQAQEIQTTFEQMAKKQEEILEKAQREAAKLVTEAKKEAKILSEQMREETNVSIQDTMKRTKEMLALEKESMMLEAKKELVDIVAMATEKVAEKALSGAEKTKLVETAIKDLKR